jgi:hypothetical protein
VTFGTPGPWPVENAVYGRAQGIRESPVVAMSTDEAQNRWVATRTALYLFRPGATEPVRYDVSSGLHLMGNPAEVYEASCGGGTKDRLGQAAAPGISTIVGGGPNEVFVGYFGIAKTEGDCQQPNADPAAERHSGKVDWVKLNADGTIEVRYLDLVNTGMGYRYFENRTVERLLYDHFIHPGDLYVGADHGVTMVRTSLWAPQPPGVWAGAWMNGWIADHLHAEAHTEGGTLLVGEWRGLALDPSGDLWHAGNWAAGLIRYEPDPLTWVMRSGEVAYPLAFGEPYATNKPVFDPGGQGLPVSLSAVGVGKDGRIWFASDGRFGRPSFGIASWRPREGFTRYGTGALGFPSLAVRDLVVLPDGRLAVASPSAGVSIWNPDTGEVRRLRAGSGLPSDQVLQLDLDAMVDPPTLHVTTPAGAAAIRVLP